MEFKLGGKIREDIKEVRGMRRSVYSFHCWGWVLIGLSCKDRSGDYRGYACNQDYRRSIFFVNDKIRDMALGVRG